MSHDFFPPSGMPLLVAANTKWTGNGTWPSGLPIPENVGPDQDGITYRMYLRIAVLGASLSTGADPSITMAVMPPGGMTLQYATVTAGGATKNISFGVAKSVKVTMTAVPVDSTVHGSLYKIVLEFSSQALALTTGRQWFMQIQNNDSTKAREFFGVAAMPSLATGTTSDAESMQPWIDISVSTTVGTATLDFGSLLISESPPPQMAVQVWNKGTGPLNLNGQVLPSNFTVATVPNIVGAALPNSIPANYYEVSSADTNIENRLVIRFAPTGAARAYSGSYSVASSDASAGVTAHSSGIATPNNQVQLKGIAVELEVILLLDASGSMDWDVAGNPRAPMQTSPPARWDYLKESVQQFLSLLTSVTTPVGAVAGAVRSAIVTFPDVTLYDPAHPNQIAAPPASAKILLAKDSLTNIQAAVVTKLNTYTPKTHHGGTPIADGLFTVMGDPNNAADYGLFQAPDAQPPGGVYHRWIVLMSDGTHNVDGPTVGVKTLTPTDFNKAAFNSKGIGLIAVPYGSYGVQNNATVAIDRDALRALADSAAPTTALKTLDFVDVDSSAGTVSTTFGAANDYGKSIGMSLEKGFRNVVLTTVGQTLQSTTDPGGFLTDDRPEGRHEVLITPYDRRAAFVANWGGDDASVHVHLLTPYCELLTPENAGAHPGVRYFGGGRHGLYAIDDSYLRNAADPARPRYGTWRLIVSRKRQLLPHPTAGSAAILAEREAALLPEGVAHPTTPYEYEVIVRSDLQLAVEIEGSAHAAGDKVRVTARLTEFGLPVPYASVKIHVTSPRAVFKNTLARGKTNPHALVKAQELLKGDPETNDLMVKAQALTDEGVAFDPTIVQTVVPMTDAGGGVYHTTLTDTSTPGSHKLHIIAIGEDASGVAFRRERTISLLLRVRPVPHHTQIHASYQALEAGGRSWFQAALRVYPRDRFGNVVLIDPKIDRQTVSITASGGEMKSPLVGHGDGSYSQTMVFPAESPPRLRLHVAGQEVTRHFEVPHFARLVYVDRVVESQLGGDEGGIAGKERGSGGTAEGALGDVMRKPADGSSAVALGGTGSVTFGLSEKSIAARSVTVFVDWKSDLCPYRIDVLPAGSSDGWLTVGESAGITHTFSLQRKRRWPSEEERAEHHKKGFAARIFEEIEEWLGLHEELGEGERANIGAYQAIRIIDLSGGRSRDPATGETPGVQLLGVGFEP